MNWYRCRYERTANVRTPQPPHRSEAWCGSFGATGIGGTVDDGVRFRRPWLMGNLPNLPQRENTKVLGASLVATNYALKALVYEGRVKVRNFRASDNKMR
jgi:hypothetical protein